MRYAISVLQAPRPAGPVSRTRDYPYPGVKIPAFTNMRGGNAETQRRREAFSWSPGERSSWRTATEIEAHPCTWTLRCCWGGLGFQDSVRERSFGRSFPEADALALSATVRYTTINIVGHSSLLGGTYRNRDGCGMSINKKRRSRASGSHPLGAAVLPDNLRVLPAYTCSIIIGDGQRGLSMATLRLLAPKAYRRRDCLRREDGFPGYLVRGRHLSRNCDSP